MTKRPGEIYVVQVSNSALDPATAAYPASKIVFRRDKLDQGTGAITADTTFGTGGKLELTAGVTGQMCGETTADGTSCVVTLPAGARPNATPMGILRADGDGFQVLATWYLPAVDGCNDGTTYLTLHEFRPSTWTIGQKFAMKLASEPVTSAVFVGGKLYFARQGAITDLTGFLPSGTKFSLGGAPSERFRRTGWTERP